MTENQKADELMAKFRNKKWVVIKVIDEILSIECLKLGVLEASLKDYEANSSREFWLSIKEIIINREV